MKRTRKQIENIYIDDLLLIIRFWGYVKNEYAKSEDKNHIFIRGQVDDFHEDMLPTLFRKTDSLEILRKRLEAYEKVTKEIKKIHRIRKAARFIGEIGSAILQHYGLNTPWLDLIDNIFVGIWFARNEMDSKKIEQGVCEYKKVADDKCGWIYLLKANYGGKTNNEGVHSGKLTKWCDLRSYHQSLSLRPHAQHGIVIAKSNYSDDKFHLNDEIVATIKFPVKLKNNIEDVKTKHMFPSEWYDNTYKYLLDPKINKTIEETEKEFDFHNKELGRIFTVKNNDTKSHIDC